MANASKYRVKQKKKPSKKRKLSDTGTPKEQPLIGKGKILLILLFGTIIVAGVYIASMIAMLEAVFFGYWILTTVMLCVYIFIYMKTKSLYTKDYLDDNLTSERMEFYRHRTKQMKYFLLVIMPFVFTIIGDAIYLLFLKDLHIIDAIKSLL